MLCQQTQSLSAWVDGELPEPEVLALQVHVATCPACAAELDELRAVSRLMSAARESQFGEPSQIALARLRKHVEGLVESADSGLLWIARVFSGVAAAVLIGGLWLVNHTPSPPVASAGWERVAITLSFDPTPRSQPNLHLPESIVADLSGRDAAEVEQP